MLNIASTIPQGVSGSFGMTGERSRASRVLDGSREAPNSSLLEVHCEESFVGVPCFRFLFS